MTEAEPLQRGATLPVLVLPEVSGKEVRTGDFRGRCNLVLFLSHPPGCPGCEGILQELAAGYGGVTAADAEVLAIVPGALEAIALLKLRLGLPFPVLIDAAGAIGGRLGGGPAIVVVDRFGEVFALSRDEGHDLMPVLEVAEWLEFIGVQCPE